MSHRSPDHLSITKGLPFLLVLVAGVAPLRATGSPALRGTGTPVESRSLAHGRSHLSQCNRRRTRYHGHPAEYRVRKQEKSATFRIGGVVLPSQLAYGSPDAYFVRKQEKSFTFRI